MWEIKYEDRKPDGRLTVSYIECPNYSYIDDSYVALTDKHVTIPRERVITIKKI